MGNCKSWVCKEEHRRKNAILAAFTAALKDIAGSDDIDNALDPERNKRVARATLEDSANG